MEIKYLKNDIELLCVKASSFPQGVMEAHEKLATKVSPAPERRYYGISHPVKNEIVYKAAASEVFPGEAEKLHCERQTIRHGLFLTAFIPRWQEKAPQIQDVFQTLIADPRVDAKGYCLEAYVGDHDMQCMVPLDTALVMHHDRKELSDEIEKVYADLARTVSRFSDAQFNTVPFEGSWTGGQVVDHIIKATGSLPDHKTKPVDREYNGLIGPVLEVFSDYTIRMQSPDFVAPGDGPFTVSSTLADLRSIQDRHLESIRTCDLHALCLDFELPHTGFFTRYEWYKFFACHAQRHLHQLKNILQKVE